jgi:hypothetical protein
MVDDFLEVVRWSTEFGADTTDERRIKQTVVCVFAGLAFDPAESVALENETKITAEAYAARINIQLVKAADLNGKMRERGLPEELTIQSVYRATRDEKETRKVLSLIWEAPDKAKTIIAETVEKNKVGYTFERTLEKEKEGFRWV